MAPGHLGAPVQVTFAGHALDRGVQPTYAAGTCSQVACHGAGLTDVPAVTPVWTDATGAASRCGACHPIPPTQHTPSMSCNRSTCHGSEIELDPNGLPLVSATGVVLHDNGVIDVVQP
jgi:predicted CxxxxCH...CXXCH cytochrome family protein